MVHTHRHKDVRGHFEVSGVASTGLDAHTTGSQPSFPKSKPLFVSCWNGHVASRHSTRLDHYATARATQGI